MDPAGRGRYHKGVGGRTAGGPGSALRALALATALAAGCAGPFGPEADPDFRIRSPRPPEGTRTRAGLEYERHESGPLLLDLHLPPAGGEEPLDASPLPLVVVVHGGGWRQGSRRFAGWPTGALGLVAEGFAVASIDYRLTDVARFPAQIRDVTSAVCWLRAEAGELGLDPDRIAIWGASAGGHLAALAGLAGGVPHLEGRACAGDPEASRVQAVVDFFGPSDLLSLAADREEAGADEVGDVYESLLLGGPPGRVPEAAAEASPLSWVSGEAPPFLLVHGDADALVPLVQSVRLHEALIAAGAHSELLIVRGGGHGLGGDFAGGEPFDVALDFLRRQLGTPGG